jgi:hypothetical protein
MIVEVYQTGFGEYEYEQRGVQTKKIRRNEGTSDVLLVQEQLSWDVQMSLVFCIFLCITDRQMAVSIESIFE